MPGINTRPLENDHNPTFQGTKAGDVTAEEVQRLERALRVLKKAKAYHRGAAAVQAAVYSWLPAVLLAYAVPFLLGASSTVILSVGTAVLFFGMVGPALVSALWGTRHLDQHVVKKQKDLLSLEQAKSSKRWGRALGIAVTFTVLAGIGSCAYQEEKHQERKNLEEVSVDAQGGVNANPWRYKR